ncbi:uncharacterized protein LODBEIA_P32110 [Lodderomyces beijingensis]|uniref:BHLH domain-containing protein n=1 Tax=Lodderomyces beijingensis TaxID=1775926 RepID=A0ABP0ZRU9_9ASCO
MHTSQDHANPPHAKSSSISSISSVSSIETNNSTKDLIKNMSPTAMSNANTPQQQPPQTTNKLPQSVASKTNFYNDLDAKSRDATNVKKNKPIKFTVRKVSHEPINSGNPNYSFKPSQNKNSPQGSAVGTSDHQDSSKLKSKLKSAQSKYCDYEVRVIKIQKEIEFLTQLLPPYNVEIDYSTRVKINKAIEKLKNKQDEVEKKKYTLGMTISRLTRGYEGGEIWVRKFDS